MPQYDIQQRYNRRLYYISGDVTVGFIMGTACFVEELGT